MLKSDMQIIFQDPFSSLNPHHTIAESIEEPVLLNGKRMGGRLKICSLGPNSTHCPRYITAMVSERWCTTLRSWVIKI